MTCPECGQEMESLPLLAMGAWSSAWSCDPCRRLAIVAKGIIDRCKITVGFADDEQGATA